MADNDGAGADLHPYGAGSHGLLENERQMPACYPIKGNVRGDGTQLYHRPDSRNYGATAAEVWFDSPSAAESAGFELAPTHPRGSTGAEYEPGRSGHPCTAEQVMGNRAAVPGGVLAGAGFVLGAAVEDTDLHPHGIGSHAPLDDEAEMPACYPVKGNVRGDGTQFYHRPDSRNYGAVVAEVWFDSPSAAEAAGFELAPTHPRGSTGEEYEPGRSGHPCTVAEVDENRAASAGLALGTSGSGIAALAGVVLGADSVDPDLHPYGVGSHALLDELGESPDCYPVKGNLRKDGSKLYHRPDSRSYAATKAEVWFDSPSAAEAAGFVLAPTHPRHSTAADHEPGGSQHPCTVEQISANRASAAGVDLDAADSSSGTGKLAAAAAGAAVAGAAVTGAAALAGFGGDGDDGDSPSGADSEDGADSKVDDEPTGEAGADGPSGQVETVDSVGARDGDDGKAEPGEETGEGGTGALAGAAAVAGVAGLAAAAGLAGDDGDAVAGSADTEATDDGESADADAGSESADADADVDAGSESADADADVDADVDAGSESADAVVGAGVGAAAVDAGATAEIDAPEAAAGSDGEGGEAGAAAAGAAVGAAGATVGSSKNREAIERGIASARAGVDSSADKVPSTVGQPRSSNGEADSGEDDRAAALAAPLTGGAAGGFGLARWLGMGLALLALVLLLGWLLSRCGDDEEAASGDGTGQVEPAGSDADSDDASSSSTDSDGTDSGAATDSGAGTDSGAASDDASDQDEDAATAGVDDDEDATTTTEAETTTTTEAETTTTTEAETTTTAGGDSGPSDLQALAAAALADAGIDGVEVEVDGDSIRLAGELGSEDDRTAAEAAVAGLDGVGSVANEITVAGETPAADATDGDPSYTG